MPKLTEFVAHLLDLLGPLGEVNARSMFGGWGFYHGEKMFGLVADDTFYVKVDDNMRDEFVAQRLVPFSYESKIGRREIMSYYTVPADAMDSSALLCEWAAKGIEAAARAATKKRRVKRPSTRAYKLRGSSSR
jgi:DNA transformation protein